MKEQLTQLLNTLYEAEGLVEMALRRHAGASDRVVRLVADKCCDVARLAAAIPLPDKADDNVDGEDELPLYAATPEPPTSDAPGTDEDKAAEEEDAVEVFTKEVLPKATAFAKPSDISDASIFDNDAEAAEEPDLAQEHSPMKESPKPFTSVHTQKSAKPLIAFFSINDKYRFRRELFAGSDTEMRKCLDCIESLEDADSARHYCHLLGWDSDSRTVKDFLTITERYFNS